MNAGTLAREARGKPTEQCNGDSTGIIPPQRSRVGKRGPNGKNIPNCELTHIHL
jgi:hypothetical protein